MKRINIVDVINAGYEDHNNIVSDEGKINMKQNNNFNFKRIAVIAIVAIVAVAAAYGYEKIIGNKASSADGRTTKITVAEDRNIIIPVKDITETATFYPASINGTDLEVIAVKAPDGTIRTAFNTCQVCFDSGRG